MYFHCFFADHTLDFQQIFGIIILLLLPLTSPKKLLFYSNNEQIFKNTFCFNLMFIDLSVQVKKTENKLKICE